ncbi:MAG: transglutaminase domain-containing protein [Acaryochloris sp. SU_5_25]|nr:transglutaminase domain-containing protein [Acaryochloris sp. SU_5_25]
MVFALEAREWIKRRWTLSADQFKFIPVLAGLLWLLSIVYLPLTSPSPLSYSASYHLLKCLPVGLFPFILCQTYCANFASLYSALFRKFSESHKNINLYYPYFGICLLAASATGGNLWLFLTLIAGLVAGLLWSVRSHRFSSQTFGGLIILALILSILGTHQFYWLQSNVKLDIPALFSHLIHQIGSSASPETVQISEETFEPDSALTSTQSTSDPENTSNPSTSLGTSSSTSDTGTTPNPDSSSSTSSDTDDSGNSGDTDSSSGTSSSTSNTGTTTPGSLPETTQGDEGTGNTNNTNSDLHQDPGETSNPNQTPASQSTSQNNGDTGNTYETASLPGRKQGAGKTHNTQSLPGRIQGTGDRVDPETSVTQIGNRGSLEPANTILFRVVPNPNQNPSNRLPHLPFYIREATYNHYQAEAWQAVKPKFVPRELLNKRQWIFGRKTAHTNSIRILASLQQQKGLLKLPLGTSEVEGFNVKSIQVNQYGTVAVQSKPGAIAYNVQFDATQSLDSPPTSADRDIPVAEKPTIQKVLKSLNLEEKSDLETVRAVSAFFQKKFQYSLKLPQPQQSTTPLADFLLNHRSGHCEYFASATSLLLRAAGIPTRYAVGYSVHEYSPSEAQFIVRDRDAHAWVMAHVKGSWITVDTTPGNGISSETPVESTSNIASPLTEDTALGKNIPSLPEKIRGIWSSLTAASGDDIGPIIGLSVLF